MLFPNFHSFLTDQKFRIHMILEFQNYCPNVKIMLRIMPFFLNNITFEVKRKNIIEQNYSSAQNTLMLNN